MKEKLSEIVLNMFDGLAVWRRGLTCFHELVGFLVINTYSSSRTLMSYTTTSHMKILFNEIFS